MKRDWKIIRELVLAVRDGWESYTQVMERLSSEDRGDALQTMCSCGLLNDEQHASHTVTNGLTPKGWLFADLAENDVVFDGAVAMLGRAGLNLTGELLISAMLKVAGKRIAAVETEAVDSCPTMRELRITATDYILMLAWLFVALWASSFWDKSIALGCAAALGCSMRPFVRRWQGIVEVQK